MSDDTKTCPFCAETIKAAAIICRFCNRDLAGPVQRQATIPQPALRNCPSCGGNGQIRIDCGNCSGYGNIMCERCGGDGQMYVKNGTMLTDMVRCNVCHGTANVRCNRCNGSGSEQGNCSTCDGSGQMTFEEFEDIKRKWKKGEQRQAEEAKLRAALHSEEQARSARLHEQQQAEQKRREAEEAKQLKEWQRQEETEAEKHRRVEQALCVECGLPLNKLDKICLRLRHKSCSPNYNR